MWADPPLPPFGSHVGGGSLDGQWPACQVNHRGQPAAGALEYRNCAVTQSFRSGPVDRRGHRGQHRHRCIGVLGDVGDRVGVCGVAVVLGDQVDGERGHGDGWVGGHRPQAGAEHVAGIGAGAPHVQRVGRRQPVVEHAADGGQRVGGQVGELHAERVGEVRQQRALCARIMHGRNPAGLGSPSGGEQLDGVAELGQIADVHRAGRRAERLPRRMLTGKGARVCGHHGPAAWRAADGEDYDGDVLFGRAQENLAQPRDGARRLEKQPDDACFGVIERVVDVVGGVGHEFLPRRHRQPEAEAAAGTQKRGERRARVGDDADAAVGQWIWLQIPQRPNAERVVHEPHAARAADRHARVGGDSPDLL